MFTIKMLTVLGLLISSGTLYTFPMKTEDVDFTVVGTYKALIIGINEYPKEKGFEKLKKAKNDAEAIKSLLEKKYGFKQDNVKLLIDHQATFQEITSAIQVLRDSAAETDSIFIYYAGHGDIDKSGNEEKGWWIPIDAEKDSKRNFIKLRTIVDDLRDIKAKHVLLISDSCFAGALFDTTRGEPNKPNQIDEEYYKKMYENKSRYALTSGGAELVDDKNFFAHSLITELNNNEKHFIVPFEIFPAIQTYVNRESSRKQTPRFKPLPGDLNGQFVFIAADFVRKDKSVSVNNTGIPTEDSITNSLKMKFVYMKSGMFSIGSPVSEKGRYDDEHAHWVNLKGFYIQTTEVTQKQWQIVMGNNPSFNNTCEDCPVENVSWNKVHEFIEKLNAIENTDKYHLPTEAQWEYACRAGSQTPFGFGDYINTDQANFNGWFPYYNCSKDDNRKKTVVTDSLQPIVWKTYGKNENELKIYGMHGNVWEWCSDIYDSYSNHSLDEPIINESNSKGTNRVIRGGAWTTDARSCRCAHRAWAIPNKKSINIGFRLIKKLK